MGNVDLSRRCIRVFGKGGKWREIPIVTELMQDIECYLDARSRVVEGEHDMFFVTDKGKPLYANFVSFGDERTGITYFFSKTQPARVATFFCHASVG